MTRFRNQATGLYLDSNDQGKVYALIRCRKSEWQNWEIIVNLENKTFSLRNSKTGRFLESNEKGYVYTLSESLNLTNQRWFFDNQRLINTATGQALDSLSTGLATSVQTNFPNELISQNWFQE